MIFPHFDKAILKRTGFTIINHDVAEEMFQRLEIDSPYTS